MSRADVVPIVSHEMKILAFQYASLQTQHGQSQCAKMTAQNHHVTRLHPMYCQIHSATGETFNTSETVVWPSLTRRAPPMRKGFIPLR